MPDVVTIQQVRVTAKGHQLPFQNIRDGRFAGPGKPGHPDYATALTFLRGAGRPINIQGLPVHVFGAPQGEFQHPGADCMVRQSVNQNEATHFPVFGIRTEGNGLVDAKFADADVVQLQPLGRLVFECIDVYAELEGRDCRERSPRTQLKDVFPTLEQRVLVHPDHRCFEL